MLTSSFIYHSLLSKRYLNGSKFLNNFPTFNNWVSPVMFYPPSEWCVLFSSASRHRSLFLNKPCAGKKKKKVRICCKNMVALSKPISASKISVENIRINAMSDYYIGSVFAPTNRLEDPVLRWKIKCVFVQLCKILSMRQELQMTSQSYFFLLKVTCNLPASLLFPSIFK